MIKPAYYNEIDPWAAQLLRNLIAAGHIAPGDVDTRSIEDVKPDDIRNYTQHHFFAGAGVWSAALRRAGWDDSRPVCTMSCPCQPFSSAGEGNGFADERHLWPHAFHLVSQLGFERIYGEQVASKAVDPWLDLVQADLEALGYAFGALAFPSAGVGAPHIRDRTYWMADAYRGQFDGLTIIGGNERIRDDAGRAQKCSEFESRSNLRGLGHTDDTRSQGHAGHDGATGWGGSAGSVAEAGLSGRMADAEGLQRLGEYGQQSNDGGTVWSAIAGLGRGHIPADATGPTNGQWRNADWLLCRDGKWRPVEPGTFPLAHGAAARVGRLRAYGNAINLEAAYEFIMATRDY